MSRRVDLLTPALHTLYQMHMEACKAAGHTGIFPTCTLRTPAEHAALKAQGREALTVVNALRLIVDWAPITDKENARPVTWTDRSLHFAQPPDGLSRAYDIAILGPRGVIYDPKYDADANGLPDWEDIARLAETLSLPTGERLKPGIRFPWPATDPPHYQLMKA